MKPKGKPKAKKLSETLKDRPVINLNLTTETQTTQPIEDKETPIINKIKSGAMFYSNEEWAIIDQIYQRIGKEGAICLTCPEKLARAFDVIKYHYR